MKDKKDLNNINTRNILLIITIGLSIILIVFGVTWKLIDNKQTVSQDKNINIKFEKFTSSKETDNIAIPFTKQIFSKYLVINLHGEGFGKELVYNWNGNNGGIMKNDALSISHYYTDPLMGGKVTIDNLWDNNKVYIETGSGSIPTGTNQVSGAQYQTIEKQNNYNLIMTDLKGLKIYEIYINDTNNNSLFKINCDELNNYEKSKALFDKLVNNSEISFIELNKEFEILSSKKEEDSNEDIDISKWHFLPDMIQDYFNKNGLTYKYSLSTNKFNHDANGTLETLQVYSLDNKDYTVGIDINIIDETSYNKKLKNSNVFKGIKKVKLNSFEKSYIYLNSSNQASLLVNNKNNYYQIKTGIKYTLSEDDGTGLIKGNKELTKEAQVKLNQIFY